MDKKSPAVKRGITCLTVFQGVVFSGIIGANVSAFGIQCATLDDVLGAALVGLALSPFDYVMAFDVAHLARDYPPKQADQDRIAGVLVCPFINDGVRLPFEAFPSCRREPFLRVDADIHATASVSFTSWLVLPIAFKVFGEISWPYQNIVAFASYTIVHRRLRC